MDREIKTKFYAWKTDDGGRNIYTATEDKIAALEALVKKYEEALNYLKDSVEWNGDSTERMVYNVCSTALKKE